ncbi:hypothetical protein PCANC_01045 [Puccinia coronata f. sp. avenae]|uniref:Uncharacterized protein n=1 Tax=Puccinia coronata f. sp. avenae TaxID=200324 RepID=A0A2N5W6Q1_9BASI|nr:hypothetical protein PCANC_01045 [Puccinia coronata f. sp. avenae]
MRTYHLAIILWGCLLTGLANALKYTPECSTRPITMAIVASPSAYIDELAHLGPREAATTPSGRLTGARTTTNWHHAQPTTVKTPTP